MANTETFAAEIKLNNQDAVKKIKELTAELEREKQALNAMTKEGSETSKKAIADTQKRINELGKEIEHQEKITQGLNQAVRELSSMSYKDLQRTVRELNKELRSGSIEKGSEEWKRYANRIKECKAEMEKFNEATKKSKSFMTKAADFLNYNWGAITQAVGAITGLSMTIRKSAQDFADMEEAMANVRKYTGWTDEQIRSFNEDLKKMDTRTSREDLNALAGDAGRLGITSKEAVGEFVDAADKIKVALGDDLGEDAVATVGKLAQTFGDSDKMGLRGAMLATGSAVNELAASSSASAGYVVDFTSRLAGVATQAGLSQTEIMGLGAVLDSNMQQCETSSTAISQLISKMYQDPAKFAKLAGQDVTTFTNLLKTDANGALLQFLQSMQSKGGFDSLAPMFSEMGLSGTRCIGVLSTLATHLGDVKTQQDIAAKAFNEGKSVLDEYNVQNNTVQAGIDKAKKAFHEVSVELGEKLQPVVKYTISSTSLLVKGLSVLIDIVVKFRTTIIAATAALTAYYVLAKKTAIVEALTKAVEMCRTAFIALNVAIRANPWVAVATVIGTAITLFIDLTRETKKHVEQQTALEKVNKNAAKAYEEQSSRVKYLSDVVHDNNAMLALRKKALAELKQIVPGYLGELTKEGALINDNRKAIDEYLVSLERQIKLKAAQEELEALYRKKRKYDKIVKSASEAAKANDTADPDVMAVTGVDTSKLNINKGVANFAKQQIADLNKDIKELNDEIKTTATSMADLGGDSPAAAGGGGGTGSSTTKKTKTETDPKKKAADDAKASYQAQIAEEMIAYRQGVTTYTDYLEEKHNLTVNYYNRIKSIYGEDSNEYKKLMDDKESAENEYYQMKAKLQESTITSDKLERDHQIQMQYLDETNRETYQNEELLNENLFKSDIAYMRQKQNLYNNGSKEWEDYEQQIHDAELKHSYQLEENYMKKLADYKKQFSMMSVQEQENLELQSVEKMYSILVEQGKMTEDEYKKIIQNIKLQFADLEAEQEASNNTRQKGSNALDTAKKKAGISDNNGYGGSGDIVSSIGDIYSAVQQQEAVNEQLKELYEQGAIDYATYEEAKRQNAQETANVMLSSASAAMNEINSLLSAASSYVQACSDLETAKITKDYDTQIKAAGNNSKKKEKLEEERDKKIAAAKTKANKKAMVIEIAQAVASTAMAAINAYSSAAQVPYIGYILGPIAAATATAAGLLQIATIKKQHEAEQAGYYSGGFTGGHRYKKEAGVVHEGEFVANHEAVNNPQIAPVFDLLATAQKNNKVGSLTAQDVTNVMGGPASAAIVPVVNIQSNNSDIKENLDGVSDAVNTLSEILSEPIEAKMSMQNFDRDYKRYKNLLNSK